MAETVRGNDEPNNLTVEAVRKLLSEPLLGLLDPNPDAELLDRVRAIVAGMRETHRIVVVALLNLDGNGYWSFKMIASREDRSDVTIAQRARRAFRNLCELYTEVMSPAEVDESMRRICERRGGEG